MPITTARSMPWALGIDFLFNNKGLLIFRLNGGRTMQQGSLPAWQRLAVSGSAVAAWPGQPLFFQSPIQRAFADAQVRSQFAARAAKTGHHLDGERGLPLQARCITLYLLAVHNDIFDVHQCYCRFAFVD